MLLNKLSAISPVDGRYRAKTKSLSPYFSEFGLIQYRVRVEVEYFIALCELPLPQLADFPASLFEELRSVYRHFNLDQAQAIKDIEKETNHDVKAVEYFLKQVFDDLNIGPVFFELATSSGTLINIKRFKNVQIQIASCVLNPNVPRNSAE